MKEVQTSWWNAVAATKNARKTQEDTVLILKGWGMLPVLPFLRRQLQITPYVVGIIFYNSKTVPVLPKRAFKDCRYLKIINFSQSYIGKEAFMNCTSLMWLNHNIPVLTDPHFDDDCIVPGKIHINMPYGCKKIGKNAFMGCTSCTDVDLKYHIKTIEPGTFFESGVTKIDMGSALKKIRRTAFLHTRLTEINVGKNVVIEDESLPETCAVIRIRDLSDTSVENERLVLRPVQKIDAGTYLHLMKDTEYLKYYGNFSNPETLWGMRKKLGKYHRDFQILNTEHLMFTVIDASSGQRVGFVSGACNEEMSDMHIGWVICKNQQGKGYATDAVRLLTRWITEYLPEISGIKTVIHLENKASMRVAEKIGMTVCSDVYKSRGMDAVAMKMIFA